MSIWQFLQSLWSSSSGIDEDVARTLPQYRMLSNDLLIEQLRTCEYWCLPAAEPGKPSMIEANAVRSLLGSVEAGAFRELVSRWPEVLNELRDAERACGYKGRPFFIDYDIMLTCLVRVLAERQTGDR